MKSGYLPLLIGLSVSGLPSQAQDYFTGIGGLSDQTRQTLVAQTAQAELGCCVFMTPQPKCASTNRTYCESRAKQNKVESKFYPNLNCKQVKECQ